MRFSLAESPAEKGSILARRFTRGLMVVRPLSLEGEQLLRFMRLCAESGRRERLAPNAEIPPIAVVTKLNHAHGRS
jgi:hypothetical protein